MDLKSKAQPRRRLSRCSRPRDKLSGPPLARAVAREWLILEERALLNEHFHDWDTSEILALRSLRKPLKSRMFAAHDATLDLPKEETAGR
jgi:hypothetical protein